MVIWPGKIRQDYPKLTLPRMTFYPDPLYLILDLGNTRAKVAVYSGDTLEVIHHIDNPDPEKVRGLDLSNLPFSAGIICSVSAEPALYTSLFPQTHWVLLDHTTPVPVKNTYRSAETLGKDRLAAVAGAYSQFPGHDLLVIDAGTALTIDLITRTGEYPGGSISPGLSMRFRALNTFTSKLPLMETQAIDFLTGRTTGESILSGVINGMRAEIDGMIGQYRLTYPEIVTVLTGGDAIYFEKILKNNIFANPNLVLTGLKQILDYNIEK